MARLEGPNGTDDFGVLEDAPDLRAALARYGSPASEQAPYVLVGALHVPERGVVGGILAFADNELFAHRLRKEVSRYALHKYGAVCVRRTEWNPKGATFEVQEWRARVRAVDARLRVGSDRVVITPDVSPTIYAELLSA